jgi:hypothetical protein
MVERDMFDLSVMADAFAKVAASRGRFTLPQSRQGRRPMRVDTMLKKEQEGTLFKKASDFSDTAVWRAFDDELEKMGEAPPSQTEVRRAIRAYNKLKDETPDPRNVAAYAATGAAISPAMQALKAPIEGRAPSTPGRQALEAWQEKKFGPQTPVPKARGPLTARNAPTRAWNAGRRAALGGSTARKYLASSLGGAAFMGAMPFVRHQVDKAIQRRKLQRYLSAQGSE